MRRSFASVILAAFAWLLATGFWPLIEEPGARSQEPGASGQDLLAQAVRRLDGETAISAELRYRVNAFGHDLAGTGSYLQLGAGPQRLLRLELRMQVGER